MANNTNNINNYPSKSYINDENYDGKKSKTIAEAEFNKTYERYLKSDLYTAALHGSNLFKREEIDIYNNIYRYGIYNPYGAVKGLKEYLFFTKPDLNIISRLANGVIEGEKLNDEIKSLQYWKDLFAERPDTIKMLQESYSPGWNMLLQNSVISNLEIPGIEGTVIESPTNNYGVGFQYRGTSEASDDSLEFALEFKDTKWLDVYYFFKSYEEYQILKHHGVVSPWRGYITNRILHDQFAIYKFMVDEDNETLIYWCKLYGVMPMNLPREVFSTADFSNGLSYTINFKAAFFEDMRKDILMDFNNVATYFENASGSSPKYQYETYNDNFGTSDFRPAKSAYIAKYQRTDTKIGNEPTWVYKLKWKGDKAI